MVAGTEFVLPTRYELIKPIGHGAYGVVISCNDTVTEQRVAIKKVPKAFDDVVDAKRVSREIKLLRFMNHENMMSVINIVRPPTLDQFRDVYIVSPLMETDLHRIIYSRQDLSSDHVQYFVYQILRALKYMHSANVIHRDLKPSNLLLNSNCELKICDFGLARGLEEKQELTEYVVTRWYRAPEIMLSCQKYSKAIDVWSVGCIFAELLNRRPIFPGDNYIHQLKLIHATLGSPTDQDLHFVTSAKARRFMKSQKFRKRQNFARLYPTAVADAVTLLQAMLVFDPKKRITVEQALKHPHLESLHCEEDEPGAPCLFNFDFDKNLNKEEIRMLVFEDMCAFHPAAVKELDAVRASAKRKATETENAAAAADSAGAATSSKDASPADIFPAAADDAAAAADPSHKYVKAAEPMDFAAVKRKHKNTTIISMMEARRKRPSPDISE